MATNLYLADDSIYVSADTMDDAVSKYVQVKEVEPTTMTLFKSSTYLVVESTIIAITPGVLPTAAITAGSTISPDSAVFIKEGDQITFVATGAGVYSTFVNFTDGDSNVLSTSTPYTYTATDADITINANFTT